MTAPTKMALVPVEASADDLERSRETAWTLLKELDRVRSEIARIADDYHPNHPREDAQALAEMREALLAIDMPRAIPPDGLYEIRNGVSSPVSASPSSGRLTAADLERAAEGRWIRVREMDAASLGCPSDFSPWSTLSAAIRKELVEEMRAAFAAIGLPVEGEQG